MKKKRQYELEKLQEQSNYSTSSSSLCSRKRRHIDIEKILEREADINNISRCNVLCDLYNRYIGKRYHADMYQKTDFLDVIVIIKKQY